ncbi:hypothetical protein GGF50DRAFT_125059 [Schizophyllum commune]
MCFNAVNFARLQVVRSPRQARDLAFIPGIGGAFAPIVSDGNLASDGTVRDVALPCAASDFLADGGFANDVAVLSVFGGAVPSDAPLVRCPNCGEWISITQPYGSCPNCSGKKK